MSDNLSVYLGEDFLAHYGVKGMHWGIRNDKEKPPRGPASAARVVTGYVTGTAVGAGAGYVATALAAGTIGLSPVGAVVAGGVVAYGASYVITRSIIQHGSRKVKDLS